MPHLRLPQGTRSAVLPSALRFQIIPGPGFSAWVLIALLTLPYAITTARAVLTLEQFEDLVPVTSRTPASGLCGASRDRGWTGVTAT
jgi:hypothetical protein